MPPSIEFANILLSLLIATVSLVVSLVALRIAKKVMVFTSRDFVPDIECFFENKDGQEELRLKNKDKDLFTINQVAFLKVNVYGFEDGERRVVVSVPLIAYSKMRTDLGGAAEVTINDDTAHACAFICPYPPELTASIKNRIMAMRDTPGLCHALPSLQTVKCYAHIMYTNRFRERKELVFLKRHIHGLGYDQLTISPGEFAEVLMRLNHPNFADQEQLWQYTTEKFAVPFETFYGAV